MSERLSGEQMAALDRIIVGDDGVRPIMFPWMAKALKELRERRAADREFMRIADVCRGYFKRNFAYPTGAVADLLDRIDRLIKSDAKAGGK